MEHYFTNNSNLKSKPKLISFEFNDKKFNFKTDIGVFCNDYLDEGSYALTKTLQRPVIMFVISFVVNSISTTFIGGDNNVILDIMLSIFSIVVASVCGYTTGVNDFKHQEDRVKSRTVFLTLFCQKNNI